jgi:hypothetical protein
VDVSSENNWGIRFFERFLGRPLCWRFFAWHKQSEPAAALPAPGFNSRPVFDGAHSSLIAPIRPWDDHSSRIEPRSSLFWGDVEIVG